MTGKLMATLPSRTYTQKTSDAGTSLFASDAILPGVEILRVERPLVSVLDTAHLQDTCSECNLWFPESGHDQRPPSERLKTCLGCRVTRYCCKVGFLFLFYVIVCCSKYSCISISKHSIRLSYLVSIKSHLMSSRGPSTHIPGHHNACAISLKQPTTGMSNSVMEHET